MQGILSWMRQMEPLSSCAMSHLNRSLSDPHSQFCAPGTLVTNNTIIARTRNCLGAINLVDAFPFKGDYRNTRIVNNHIRTEGAFIHLAMCVGWFGQGL